MLMPFWINSWLFWYWIAHEVVAGRGVGIESSKVQPEPAFLLAIGSALFLSIVVFLRDDISAATRIHLGDQPGDQIR